MQLINYALYLYNNELDFDPASYNSGLKGFLGLDHHQTSILY